MADPPVLAVECTGLEYSFGTAMIVDSVDLRVRPGEMFELPGPNGAGKTPTIRVITTLLPVRPRWSPSAGRIRRCTRCRCGGCSALSRTSCPPTPG